MGILWSVSDQTLWSIQTLHRTHNCKVIWATSSICIQIAVLSALSFFVFNRGAFSLWKKRPHNPQVKSKSSISRNTVRFHAHANGKVNNKTPAQQKLHAHMLSVLYLVWSWNQRAARRPIPGRLWLAACSGQSPGGGGASDNKWMQPRVQEQWGAAQDSQETPDQPIKDTAEALPILASLSSTWMKILCSQFLPVV